MAEVAPHQRDNPVGYQDFEPPAFDRSGMVSKRAGKQDMLPGFRRIKEPTADPSVHRPPNRVQVGQTCRFFHVPDFGNHREIGNLSVLHTGEMAPRGRARIKIIGGNQPVGIAIPLSCAYRAYMQPYTPKPDDDTNAPKRTIHLTLNAELVQRARLLTGNLSNLVDALLAQFVNDATDDRRQLNRAVRESNAVWNRFSEEHGSISDDYSTL